MQPISDPPAFRTKLNRWFARNARSLPWRGTRDPYRILVSEMMLQQTQVATVLGYYDRWMARFPDFAALAVADESDVLHAWQGLGYYSRARNLHRTAKAIASEHGGTFPRPLESIRGLPGIGRYTAGAVATFAFDESTPIVDANIARVLSRLFDIGTAIDSTSGTRALWDAAESLLPKRNAGTFNAALMELGALVCIPRKPDCGRCPVRTFCSATHPERLPVKKARPRTILLEVRVGFVQKGDRILLKRETGRRWHGLWRLPSLLALDEPADSRILTQLTYPITHHRVTLTVRAARKTDVASEAAAWFTIREVDDIPMPSPHRKALTALLAGDGITRPA